MTKTQSWRSAEPTTEAKNKIKKKKKMNAVLR